MQINLSQLHNFAENLVDDLKQITTSEALLVKLSGNLGAGKTTFTQKIAEILNIKEKITSPTFVLMKSYSISLGQFKNLIHIDAYRLESGKELLALNFQEILNNPENLILLEWPEKVQEILPGKNIEITFEVLDEESREINIIKNV